MRLGRLQKKLGHRFGSPEWLERALTHSSFANEEGIPDNERLEFLGDAVLQLAVTRHLFSEYPHLQEGQMTRVRASVVRKETLAEVARFLDLGEDLRLGKGEVQSGGKNKASILADAMEAVIGAVYQDGGWRTAERLVMAHWEELVASQASDPDARDPKTQLHELLASTGREPEYRREEEGPSHARRFRVEVWVQGSRHGVGEGSSGRLAEQRAAARALGDLFPEADPGRSAATSVTLSPAAPDGPPVMQRLRRWGAGRTGR